jgi:release factor glutamine methyltransferase
MNIKQYLLYAINILKEANIETPELEAGVMFCHVLNCSRAYIYSHDDRVLEDNEVKTLNHMLSERKQGTPLQYLVGYAEFMSLTFIVGSEVLIPRQDTEILVEKCLEIMNKMLSDRHEKVLYDDSDIEKNNSPIKVLDMCTGSACIAVSIAHYFPQSRITACDISEGALRIAETNIKRNEVQDKVRLCHGDLFEALEEENKFDLIVSNPPYIETDVIPQLQNEVRDHEPYIALDGGQDGLYFYRKIIAGAPKHLNKGGILAFEIGYNQAESVSNLMKNEFCNVSVLKDIGGNDRVITGELNL